MTTINQRINVSYDKEDLKYIAYIAKTKDISMSAAAKILTKQGIENDDDVYLAKLAEQRYTEDKSRYKSHDDVWKELLQD